MRYFNRLVKLRNAVTKRDKHLYYYSGLPPQLTTVPDGRIINQLPEPILPDPLSENLWAIYYHVDRVRRDSVPDQPV